MTIISTVYSQTDSTKRKCFGEADLKKLALLIESGNECCEIVPLQDSIIQNDKQIIAEKDSIISEKDAIIEAGQSVVVKKDKEIQDLEVDLDKAQKKALREEKWRKAERWIWGVGGFIAGAATGTGLTYILTK